MWLLAWFLIYSWSSHLIDSETWSHKIVNALQDHQDQPSTWSGTESLPIRWVLRSLTTPAFLWFSSRLTVLSNLVSSENLLRAHTMTSPRSLITMLSVTDPKTEPWGTALVTSYPLDRTPFVVTLWAQPSRQFFIQWSTNLPKLWASSFSRIPVGNTIKSLLNPNEKHSQSIPQMLVGFHRRSGQSGRTEFCNINFHCRFAETHAVPWELLNFQIKKILSLWLMV